MGKRFCVILYLAMCFLAGAFLPGKVSAQTVYAAPSEVQKLYEEELFRGADVSAYTGTARVESIAVSPSGRFALSFSEPVTHHINLYDKDCKLIRHLTYYESGGLAISFDKADDQLLIYPFRQDVVIKVDESGSYLASLAGEPAIEEGDRFHSLEPFHLSCQGNVYAYSGKRIFSMSGQTFSVTDEMGEVIFRLVFPPDYTAMAVILICGLLLPVAHIIWRFLKKKKQRLERTNR